MGGLARRAARLLTTAGGTQRGQSPSKIRRLGMNYRTFGRTGWQVSEIGYGMWGMGGWTGSDDDESHRSLDLAVELGCNFFDTAFAYGDGHSETAARAAGPPASRQAALHGHQDSAQEPQVALEARLPSCDDVFPPDYIRTDDRNEPQEPGPGLRGPACSSTFGRTIGPTTSAGSGRSTTSSARAWSAPSASASTAGSRGTA